MTSKDIQSQINTLPRTAGVYLFYEKPTPNTKHQTPIYIGKAINLRDRVKNHFMQPTYKDNLFVSRITKIDSINTNSEIEALVLEANLIKKHLPKFNVTWKDDKNYFYVCITKGERPVVFITHQPTRQMARSKEQMAQNGKRVINNQKLLAIGPLLEATYIGPFVEGAALKKTLKYLRRVFPFYTSATHPKNACTWCHLGLCPGATPNMAEYKKNLKKLSMILQGKRKTVLYALRKEMDVFAKENKFEEAGKVRDRMQALKRILEHTHVIENSKSQITNYKETEEKLREIISGSEAISKIECYDISNIQGKNAVGSMVVFIDGAPTRSQYKKFRIKMKNEPNDIAMLKEVLTRRLNHPEWGYPEVMLIDGGIAQLNVAIKVKGEREKGKDIKIISIAKGKQELLIEGKPKIALKNLPQDIYNLVKYLDDEAHRFALSYHKKVRKKALLS